MPLCCIFFCKWRVATKQLNSSGYKYHLQYRENSTLPLNKMCKECLNVKRGDRNIANNIFSFKGIFCAHDTNFHLLHFD